MTDLYPQLGYDFVLTFEQVRSLLLGGFRQRKCIGCNGTGWIHYDGADGHIMGTGYRRNDDIETDTCLDCYGFGEVIKFPEVD